MCTETVLAVGAIGLCRHNTFTGLISQHIPFVMTLHIVVTFIHTTFVSKLSNDVMITNHSLLYQKYCPDVSSCITSCITSCISSAITQRDSWKHTTPWDIVGSGDISYKEASNLLSPNNHTITRDMTPWEGIGYGDVSYKGARDLLLLINQTLSPKSLIKSVEMLFPVSYSLDDLTQSAKTLCKEKSSEDTLNSPYQAHNTGTWNDTWGNAKQRTKQCPWSPHHNQCPEVRGKLHENLFGIKDKGRKILGDSSLKRKETGIKDIKR